MLYTLDLHNFCQVYVHKAGGKSIHKANKAKHFKDVYMFIKH